MLTEEIAILLRRRPVEGHRIERAAQLLRDSFAQQRPAAFLSPAAYAVLLGHESMPTDASAA